MIENYRHPLRCFFNAPIKQAISIMRLIRCEADTQTTGYCVGEKLKLETSLTIREKIKWNYYQIFAGIL